jgi:hypothetical protein
MPPLKNLPFQHRADAPDPPEGYLFLKATVSSAGAGLFLFYSKDVHEGDRSLKLYMIGDSENRIVDIPDLGLYFPLIDVFPDGTLLLISTQQDAGGYGFGSENAVTLDPQSGQTHRFAVGYGITDVGIDAQSQIWLSYDEDAVNDGHHYRTNWQTPSAYYGLACLDRSGTHLWGFNDTTISEYIYGAYALNVSDETVWVHYDGATFDIAEVSPDRSIGIVARATPRYMTALAVSGQLVGLYTPHSDRPRTFQLAARNGLETLTFQTVRAILPKGQFTKYSYPVGRGSVFHLIDQTGWFTADLADVSLV